MIVDKKGNLFEDRRKGATDRRTDDVKLEKGKKNKRKKDRRQENNKIKYE